MPDTIRFFSSNTSFITERGETIQNPVIAYQTWGKLNENRDNVVLICHALTGSSAADQWFSGLFNSDLFNLENQFIVCANVLGGCYGSTGPQSINPATGERFQAHFPQITIRDMVRLQQLWLDSLGITGIELAVGGSMGGMQVLEWAVLDSRVKKMIVIGVGARHSAWAIGISEAQRSAIYADKNWKNGFYQPKNQPTQGLAAARMMAMLTYRTYQSLNGKFGRNLQGNSDQFQIESYLNHHGDKIVERFDALSYVRLTQAMDWHDITRDRGTLKEVLGGITIPSLIIGIDSDVLYPTVEQKEIAHLLPRGYYKEIRSIHGHDAFLIEFDQMTEIISPFLNKEKVKV